jgi:phytoene desaturase
MLTEGRKLNVFTNLDKHVRSYFDSDRACKVLEYSMVFLGGAPNNTPSLYSIMSHVDLTLGVWYPSGGMSAVADAIKRLAEADGARFVFNSPVRRILVHEGTAAGVEANGEIIEADTIVSAADYHHVDTRLLDGGHREYSDSYWRSRVVAPSAFIMFLGVSKRLESLEHHTLVLAEDWMEHFNAIFDQPEWPGNPSYYVCVPSKTDSGVAPEGCENLFVLVPVAAGLEDTPDGRKAFADMILDDLESQTGESIREHIVVYRDFAHRDFTSQYNAYKGTALGLAHTLRQTAVFRPRQISKKVEGLYHVGQYVHPGIGVPMSLISSQIAAAELKP